MVLLYHPLNFNRCTLFCPYKIFNYLSIPSIVDPSITISSDQIIYDQCRKREWEYYILQIYPQGRTFSVVTFGCKLRLKIEHSGKTLIYCCVTHKILCTRLWRPNNISFFGPWWSHGCSLHSYYELAIKRSHLSVICNKTGAHSVLGPRARPNQQYHVEQQAVRVTWGTGISHPSQAMSSRQHPA